MWYRLVDVILWLQLTGFSEGYISKVWVTFLIHLYQLFAGPQITAFCNKGFDREKTAIKKQGKKGINLQIFRIFIEHIVTIRISIKNE